jgi:hypothetical protein
MVALPKSSEQQLIDNIYRTYEVKEVERGFYLGRLGASFLGEECMRKTWLSWRAYATAKFGGRMLRLFGTGHWQEDRIVADLRAAGVGVWDRDPETGQQLEYVDETGHFIVKLDGVVKGVPEAEKTAHVLEIKTHNKNSFSGIAKHGVQKSKPEHYVQVQAGMMMSGLDRGLYVALCKDDEQFYVERLKADKPVQEAARRKITTLVNATLKPAGISPDGEGFGCKFCDMKEVCTGRAEPLKTCRSCVHVDPAALPGEWVCSITGETLSKNAQIAACGEYECL